jgi:hypothetical protein
MDEAREHFDCLHPDDTIHISFRSDSNIDGIAVICASTFDLGKLGHKDALVELIFAGKRYRQKGVDPSAAMQLKSVYSVSSIACW